MIAAFRCVRVLCFREIAVSHTSAVYVSCVPVLCPCFLSYNCNFKPQTPLATFSITDNHREKLQKLVNPYEKSSSPSLLKVHV